MFLEHNFLLPNFESQISEVPIRFLPPDSQSQPQLFLKTISNQLKSSKLFVQICLISCRDSNFIFWMTVWCLQDLTKYFVFRLQHLGKFKSRFGKHWVLFEHQFFLILGRIPKLNIITTYLAAFTWTRTLNRLVKVLLLSHSDWNFRYWVHIKVLTRIIICQGAAAQKLVLCH